MAQQLTNKSRLLEKYMEVVRLDGLNTNKNVNIGINGSTPNLWVAGNLSVGGTTNFTSDVITATSANAFAVGQNGITNPAFNVNTNTASSATGINITSAAAGSGVTVSTISSGTNENLTLNAKGAGTLNVQTTGGFTNINGVVGIDTATAPGAGGTNMMLISSTANFGIYVGSGAPGAGLSAAQGSIYLRTDGNSTTSRMYINTNGSTTWTAVTTSA